MKEKIFLSEIEDNDKVNCTNEGGNFKYLQWNGSPNSLIAAIQRESTALINRFAAVSNVLNELNKSATLDVWHCQNRTDAF